MFIVQGIAAEIYSGSVGIVIESNTKTFSTSLGAGAMAVQPNTTISLDPFDISIENEYVEGKSINLFGEYFYDGFAMGMPTEVPLLGGTNNFYLDFVTPDGFLMAFANKTAFESDNLEIPNITLFDKLYSDSPKNTIFNFSNTLQYGIYSTANKSGIAYPLEHAGHDFATFCQYFNYSQTTLGSLHSMPNSTGHKTFENRLMNLYFSTPSKLKVQYTEWNDAMAGTMYIKVYNSNGVLIGYNPLGYLEYSMDLIQMARNPSVNESIVMDIKFAAQYYTGLRDTPLPIPLGGITSPLFYHRILNHDEYGVPDYQNFTTDFTFGVENSNQGLLDPNPLTFVKAINFTLEFESHNGFFDVYFLLYGKSVNPIYGLIGTITLERFTNVVGLHNYLNESTADFSNCFFNFTQYIEPETFYPTFPTQYTMDFEFNSTYYYLQGTFLSLIDISGTYNFTHTLTLNSLSSFQTIEGVTFLRCRNTYKQPAGWEITASKANASDPDYFETVTYEATGGIAERTFTGYSYDFVLFEEPKEPEEPEEPEDPEDPENPEEPEEPETPTLPTIGSLFDGLMNISPFTKMIVLFGIIWYLCFFKQGKSITEIWNPKKK